jgi:hypothetical protein
MIWLIGRALFPSGWDRDYGRYCEMAMIAQKASFELDRSGGGSLGAAVDDGLTEVGFLELCLAGQAIPST